LTKWGELAVGLIFVLISIPIFLFTVVLGAVSSLGGSSPAAGTDTVLGLILSGGLFFGGIWIMVRSHEPSGSDITIGVRSSGFPQAAPPAKRPLGRREVSSLAKTILVGLPHGKTVEEIAKETGVDESIVSAKVQNLKTGGFLTGDGKLTQDGYEAIQ
jgi:hypothetical protein